jgi:hypothetical protein
MRAPMARQLAAAVRKALQRAADARPDPRGSRLDLVAHALVAKACTGDVQAIKAVFERIDGRAAPETDGPQTIEVVHTFASKI